MHQQDGLGRPNPSTPHMVPLGFKLPPGWSPRSFETIMSTNSGFRGTEPNARAFIEEEKRASAKDLTTQMNPSAPSSAPTSKACHGSSTHHKGRQGPQYHHCCHLTSLPRLLKHHQSLPRLPKHNQSLPRLQRPCCRRGKALPPPGKGPPQVSKAQQRDKKNKDRTPTSSRLQTSPNSRKMLRTRRPARLQGTVHCASRGRPTRSSRTLQQAPPLPGRQTPTPPAPRAR